MSLFSLGTRARAIRFLDPVDFHGLAHSLAVGSGAQQSCLTPSHVVACSSLVLLPKHSSSKHHLNHLTPQSHASSPLTYLGINAQDYFSI